MTIDRVNIKSSESPVSECIRMDHPPLNERQIETEVKTCIKMRFFYRSFQRKPEDSRPPWNSSTQAPAALSSFSATTGPNRQKSTSSASFLRDPPHKSSNDHHLYHQTQLRITFQFIFLVAPKVRMAGGWRYYTTNSPSTN